MSDEITLRDTFAAAALTGLLADDGDRTDHAMPSFTSRAYEWADAMLRERGTAVSDNCVTGNQREMDYPQPALTDEEREAIHRAEARLRTAYVPDDETAATLRALLERLA